MSSWKVCGRFVVYGFALGTAGLKLLTSSDAKSLYTHCTAAVLRCKDEVMRNVDLVRENCSDISADAHAINDARIKAAEEKEIEDAKEVLRRAEEKAAEEAEEAEVDAE